MKLINEIFPIRFVNLFENQKPIEYWTLFLSLQKLFISISSIAQWTSSLH